ncbi:hypothetical protein HK414_02830 [Ramlibacter terrae]|uniref:RapA2 cadherin-like domain-containing protein n=1 Tax=Ramlibacter terrae TaxID=2732511 RepID=A0ABX6P2B2_9BURK|nr:hypothetical protein HK414_02830 [Ramlibacter terrae]
MGPAAPAPGPEVPAGTAPPLQVTPGAQTALEDGVLVFSGTAGNAISVSDADSAVLTTTLNVSTGTLTLTDLRGVSITGNGTDSVTLRGSPAAINRALEGMAYRPLPDDTTTATLTVITSDETRSVGASVQIGVQPMPDAPVGTDDAANTRENTAVRIPVGTLLANDTDSDGGVLSITGVGGARWRHRRAGRRQRRLHAVPGLHRQGRLQLRAERRPGAAPTPCAWSSPSPAPMRPIPRSSAAPAAAPGPKTAPSRARCAPPTPTGCALPPSRWSARRSMAPPSSTRAPASGPHAGARLQRRRQLRRARDR